MDLQQAEVLAEAAIFVADRQLDQFCRGLSRRALAHVRYLHGSYEEAEGLYAEATDSFRRAGDDLEVGKTLSNSLQALILQGRHEKALDASAKARRIFEEQGEELFLARLECNVGNMLHRQDRFEEAIESYDNCLEVFENLDSDPQATAAALLNSGVCRIGLEDLDLALDCFERLRRHCAEYDLPLPAAQGDYNVAYLHLRRGEYTRAAELYRAAERSCRSSGDAHHLALCGLDLAELYLEQWRTEEGIRLATEANQSFIELGMGHEASKAQVFMALGALQEQDKALSLKLMARARDGFENEGNVVWCAIIDLYSALILLDTGRASEARRHGESALAIFSKRGQAATTIQCELLLARAELSLGMTERARKSCSSAVERIDRRDLRDLLDDAHSVWKQIEERAGSDAASLPGLGHARALDGEGLALQRTGDVKIALVQQALAS